MSTSYSPGDRPDDQEIDSSPDYISIFFVLTSNNNRFTNINLPTRVPEYTTSPESGMQTTDNELADRQALRNIAMVLTAFLALVFGLLAVAVILG